MRLHFPPSSSTEPGKQPSREGSALLLVLIISSFLLVLVLSFSVLVRMELRVLTEKEYLVKARMNARLALDLAVGQMQELAGPDQRVTARADIETGTSAPAMANPYWTGVWRREEGKPLLPGNGFDPHPAEFLGWLVSGTDSRSPANRNAEISEPERVTLLSHVNDPAERIQAGLESIEINGVETGRFAYWASDESLKARVNLEDRRISGPANTPGAEEIGTAIAQRTGRPPDPAILDAAFQGWNDPGSTRMRMRALRDAPLVEASPGEKIFRDHFHDFTTYSRGVLSDTLRGGLKKDLSLAFTMSNADFNADPFFSPHEFSLNTHSVWIPNGPLHQVSHRESFGVLSWDSTNDGQPDLFGPTWQRIRFYALLGRYYATKGTGNEDLILDAPVSPFDGLTDVEDQYVAMDAYTNEGGPDSAEDPRTDLTAPRATRPVLAPIVTQVSMAFSLGSVDRGGIRYLKFIIDPFAVLWNPYNVPLRFSAVRIRTHAPAISLTVNNAADVNNREVGELFSDGGSDSRMELYLVDRAGAGGPEDHIILQPGELRAFYPVASARSGNRELEMTADFPGGADFNASGLTYVFDGAGGRPSVQILPGETVSGRLDIDTNSSGSRSEIEFFTSLGFTGSNHWRPYMRHYTASTGAGSRHRFRAADLESFYPSFSYTFNQLADKRTLAVGQYLLKNSSADERVMIDNNLRALFLRHGAGGTPEPMEHPPLYELKFVGTGGGSLFDKVGLDVSDPKRTLGFWGAGHEGGAGSVSFASLFAVPYRPLLSLGELQHLSADDWHSSPSYAIANSFASPYLPADRISRKEGGYTQMDTSYLTNLSLFDSFYFSGIGPRADRGLTQSQVLSALSDSSDALRQPGGALKDGPLPNPRMVVRNGIPPTELETALQPSVLPSEPRDRPYTRASEYLMVEGAFNVNSTSVDAWASLLASSTSLSIPVFEHDQEPFLSLESGVTFSRSLPSSGVASTQPNDPNYWRGYRSLTPSEIEELSGKIVEEIKARGPFLSLSDFVNRRLAPETDPHSQRGALQAAIDGAGINDGREVTPTHFSYDRNAEGDADAGAPGYLIQGDILQSLAPVLTARGDTFLVRAYGDFRNAAGQVQARATCEAVVQRMPEKVNRAEHISAPDPASGMGRRFEIVGFSWIPEEEL